MNYPAQFLLLGGVKVALDMVSPSMAVPWLLGFSDILRIVIGHVKV